MAFGLGKKKSQLVGNSDQVVGEQEAPKKGKQEPKSLYTKEQEHDAKLFPSQFGELVNMPGMANFTTAHFARVAEARAAGAQEISLDAYYKKHPEQLAKAEEHNKQAEQAWAARPKYEAPKSEEGSKKSWSERRADAKAAKGAKKSQGEGRE